MMTNQNKILWFVAAFIFLISIYVQSHALLSINDVWLMICAKRWLAGGTYAHDFVENNPPLIIFISAIPVLIAKYCAISAITAMRIFVFTISFFSLLFCNALLKCAANTRPDGRVSDVLRRLPEDPSEARPVRASVCAADTRPHGRVSDALCREVGVQFEDPSEALRREAGVQFEDPSEARPVRASVCAANARPNGTSFRRIALLTIGLAFIYWILPAFAFGEREHLMIILIMPYVLCLVLRCQGSKIPFVTAVLVGFAAALGFGLKPYFLVTLVLIEIYGLCITKKIRFWFRPESVTLCITLIAYFISIFYLTPTYMTTIFPMIIHFYLGYEKYTWGKLLFHVQYLPVIVALMLPIFFRNRFLNHHLLWVFYLSIIGFIFSLLAQEKLWYYHMLPMFSFSVLLLLLCFDRWMIVLLSFFIGIPFFVFIVAQNIYAVSEAHSQQYPYVAVGAAIHRYADHRPIYYFTTQLADASSLITAHATLSPRFPAFWMLPGLLHCLHKGSKASCYPRAIQLKKYLLNAVADDFKKYRPGVVIVNTGSKQLFLKNFNYIDFFSQDAEFKKEWGHYHYEERIGDEKIYVR